MMLFGRRYTSVEKAWILRAQHENLYQNEAPIEDLTPASKLHRLSIRRYRELTRLLTAHDYYKRRWTDTVNSHVTRFKQLEKPMTNVSDRLQLLYDLSSIWHSASEMRSLQDQPFYQTDLALKQQLTALVDSIADKARAGSSEDFLLLRWFFTEVSTYSWEDRRYYQADYPDLVQRFVEHPTYEDYSVQVVTPTYQADVSDNLTFLKLFIEHTGGSQRMLQLPAMRTHAGQYFDELKLYTMYGIQAKIARLSKGKDA